MEASVPIYIRENITEEGALSRKFAWSLLKLSVKNAILAAVRLNVRFFSVNTGLEDIQ